MAFETVEAVEISAPVDEGPAVSWAAVAAGAIAAAALTLVLLAFGAGMGFSAVSPWGNSGISASTFQITTGLYLIVVALLASALGGYVAGRLRTRWVGVHHHEVFFRDTAHGFLAWAFATVIGAGFLAAAASDVAGRRGQKPSTDDRGECPRQKAMSCVTEEDFVVMNADPSCTQPPGDVTPQGRGEQRNHDQIETCGNLKCARRYAGITPRGY